jgi:hypothetical protein
MKNIKVDIVRANGKNILVLSCDLEKSEVERLTPENRLFLGQTDTSDCGLVSIPVSRIGALE